MKKIFRPWELQKGDLVNYGMDTEILEVIRDPESGDLLAFVLLAKDLNNKNIVVRTGVGSKNGLGNFSFLSPHTSERDKYAFGLEEHIEVLKNENKEKF